MTPSKRVKPTAVERKEIAKKAAKYDLLSVLRWVPEDERPYPVLFERLGGDPNAIVMVCVIGTPRDAS